MKIFDMKLGQSISGINEISLSECIKEFLEEKTLFNNYCQYCKRQTKIIEKKDFISCNKKIIF